MLKIYDLWLKTMILVVLCFIGYEFNQKPYNEYKDKLSNIEKEIYEGSQVSETDTGSKLKVLLTKEDYYTLLDNLTK